MAWILFGLACLIIIILSIRLFIVSWQHEDLRDQNRILQSKIQELKDEEKDLTDQNKDLKNINKNLREKIILESKLENKNSGISNDENRNNMVRENTGDHEVILVNADINKDLSISHSSYQINSKVLKGFNRHAVPIKRPYGSFQQRDASVFMASCRVAKRKSNSFKSNSFGKSRIQNLAISQTNLIINNNNIGIGRDLQNKYGTLKIVENINFDVIDNRHYCNKGMEVLRQPGIFRQRLEEKEKIKDKQLSRRYRNIKSKLKNMSAPKPIDDENANVDKQKKKEKRKLMDAKKSMQEFKKYNIEIRNTCNFLMEKMSIAILKLDLRGETQTFLDPNSPRLDMSNNKINNKDDEI